MATAQPDEKQPIPNQVFVGGMTPETTVAELTKHFESLQLTPVGAPNFFTTPAGVSKGCALVPFASPEAVTAAIEKLHNSKLGDRPLVARVDKGRRARREVNQDGTYLYVGNLDPEVTAQELHDLFAPEGKLQYCTISRKRGTDRSLGWATVQLPSEEDATKAQKALHGSTFKERELTVEPLRSIPRPARKPRPRKEPREAAPAAETPEQPQTDPRVVWVGNLPFSVGEDDIRSHFEQHGEVQEIAITRDKRSKESRGWGTVTYATPEEAAEAVENLNELKLEDRAIRVQIRRGPRARRRRAPPQQATDAEPAESDGKKQGGGRRRRPVGRSRFTRRRPANQEGDTEAPAQEAKGGDGEEGQPRVRARRRLRRNEKKDEGTVAVHLPAETDGKDEGGAEEGDKPRRRPRRRNNRNAGEGGAKEEGAPRERKQPTEVVENPTCHLYVRNVPWGASAEDLKRHFEEHAGTVVSAKITVNTKGLSRGWGTVQMGSPEEAQAALELKEPFQERELFVRQDRRVRGGE